MVNLLDLQLFKVINVLFKESPTGEVIYYTDLPDQENLPLSKLLQEL